MRSEKRKNSCTVSIGGVGSSNLARRVPQNWSELKSHCFGALKERKLLGHLLWSQLQDSKSRLRIRSLQRDREKRMRWLILPLFWRKCYSNSWRHESLRLWRCDESCCCSREAAWLRTVRKDWTGPNSQDLEFGSMIVFWRRSPNWVIGQSKRMRKKKKNWTPYQVQSQKVWDIEYNWKCGCRMTRSSSEEDKCIVESVSCLVRAGG